VTFEYRNPFADGSHPTQYGLIAEEVAEVMPDLVAYNEAGEPETVKYHVLPALLLNEVQRQQRTIQELEHTIASQANGLRSLTERLRQLETALASMR